MMSKSNSTLYIVRSEHKIGDIHVFTSRPVLAQNMTRIARKEWVLETLHYHLTKKKKTEFSKDGWHIRFYELDVSTLNEEFVYIILSDKDEIEHLSIGLNSILKEMVVKRGHKGLNAPEMEKGFHRIGKFTFDGVTIYRRGIIR